LNRLLFGSVGRAYVTNMLHLICVGGMACLLTAIISFFMFAICYPLRHLVGAVLYFPNNNTTNDIRVRSSINTVRYIYHEIFQWLTNVLVVIAIGPILAVSSLLNDYVLPAFKVCINKIILNCNFIGSVIMGCPSHVKILIAAAHCRKYSNTLLTVLCVIVGSAIVVYMCG
jgi:hypothetical protein